MNDHKTSETESLPCPFECGGKLELRAELGSHWYECECEFQSPTRPTPEAALAAAKRVRVLPEGEASAFVKRVRTIERRTADMTPADRHALRYAADLAELAESYRREAERLKTELDRQREENYRRWEIGQGRLTKACARADEAERKLAEAKRVEPPAAHDLLVQLDECKRQLAEARGERPEAGEGDPIEPTEADVEELAQKLRVARAPWRNQLPWEHTDNFLKSQLRDAARAAYRHIGQEAVRLRRERDAWHERRDIAEAERDAALAKLDAVRDLTRRDDGIGYVYKWRIDEILYSPTPPKPPGEPGKVDGRTKAERDATVPPRTQQMPFTDPHGPGNGPIQPLRERLTKIEGALCVAFGEDYGDAIREHLARVERLDAELSRLWNILDAIRETLTKTDRIDRALRALTSPDGNSYYFTVDVADAALAILNGTDGGKEQ